MIRDEVVAIIEKVAENFGYASLNNLLLEYSGKNVNEGVYVDKVNESVHIILSKAGAIYFMEKIEFAINEELSKINYKLDKLKEDDVNDITFKIVQLQ